MSSKRAESIKKIAELCEQSAVMREAVALSDDYEMLSKMNLVCAGMGMLLLADLGASDLETHQDHDVVVSIGPDAIQGEKMIEAHAALLRRLGWARVEYGERPSYKPLLMRYVR